MVVNLLKFRHLARAAMAIIVLAYGISVPTSFAQSASGRLVGTVSGPDGVLANASIVVTDNQTKQTHIVTTNSQGAFIFPQLDVGSYSVSVSAKKALRHTGGNQRRAAQLLNLNATTLNAKLKNYGIDTFRLVAQSDTELRAYQTVQTVDRPGPPALTNGGRRKARAS